MTDEKQIEDKKQIEEMARTVCCFPNVMAFYETCEECDKSSECKTYKNCKVLYDLGYRKLPEDSVVLTKKEQAEYMIRQAKAIHNAHERGVQETLYQIKNKKYEQNEEIANVIAEYIAQARKETAREIMEKLSNKVPMGDGNGKGFITLWLEEINELAKQFGVELEE